MFEQLLSFFVTNAYADNMGPVPGAQPQAGGMPFMLMMAIFVVFIYFFVWRPQSKRAREQSNLLSSLAKGDEVMTAGGLLGRITKISEQYIGLAVSSNVEILLQKNSVVSILPKGTLKAIE